MGHTLKFYHRVFNVMGKALSGQLSYMQTDLLVRGTAPVTSLSYSELNGGTKGNSSCYFLELQRAKRWDQGEQLLLLP